MPYFSTEPRCICGSGRYIFGCHGAYDSGSNIVARVSHLMEFIGSNQSESFLLQKFNSLAFRKIRMDLAERLSLSQKTAAVCIERGMDLHITFGGTHNNGTMIPAIIPPELILYLPENFGWSDIYGQTNLDAGVYRIRPESWWIQPDGTPEGIISFRVETGGKISVNNQQVAKYTSNMLLLWGMIQSKIGVVKSVVVLETEILRHNAA